MQPITLNFTVSADDLTCAGEASGEIKRVLKKLGFSSDIVRRVAIAAYEAEINMVIHADGGTITAWIAPDEVCVEFADVGPGIPDIGLAMQEGYSTASETIREFGFGAGMGIPNIKKYTDELDIQTRLQEGTTLTFKVKVA